MSKSSEFFESSASEHYFPVEVHEGTDINTGNTVYFVRSLVFSDAAWQDLQKKITTVQKLQKDMKKAEDHYEGLSDKQKDALLAKRDMINNMLEQIETIFKTQMTTGGEEIERKTVYQKFEYGRGGNSDITVDKMKSNNPYQPKSYEKFLELIERRVSTEFQGYSKGRTSEHDLEKFNGTFVPSFGFTSEDLKNIDIRTYSTGSEFYNTMKKTTQQTKEGRPIGEMQTKRKNVA